MIDTDKTYLVGLPDDRTLSYSDIGTGEKGTWIHCHGIPGSRKEAHHLQEQLVHAGVRLIIPDRPGYGQSTPAVDYGFSQHSNDLKQLADHLELATFSLSGFSGGGVFAMAAAHDLGNRIKQLVIAATPAVPLMDDPFTNASQLTSSTWQLALTDQAMLAIELEGLTASEDTLSSSLIDAAGEHEASYLKSDSFYPSFLKNLSASVEHGAAIAAKALSRDIWLTASPWPFNTGSIHLPIRIIHGTEDPLVFQTHQDILASKLRGSVPEVTGGGHYAVMPEIWLRTTDQ
jgi:pimeloyl-ACP methyl ester carboxylesterase